MGQLPKKDEINFNYPIPRSLHFEVRKLSLVLNIPVKDIVINALIQYVKDFKENTKECPIYDYTEDDDL